MVAIWEEFSMTTRKLHPLFLLLFLLTACSPAVTPTIPGPTTTVPTESRATSVALVPTTTAPTPLSVPTDPRPTRTMPTAPPTATPTRTPTPLPAGQFAAYVTEPVQVQPAVSQEPIAADLSNVSSALLLSPQQRQHIAQDGFVVSPSEEKEFYVLYEKARYNYEPILVTTDSLLHTYHLLFDKLLRALETEEFIPALQELNARMLLNAQAQYEELRGTMLEESARRNVAFFAVGSWLLDPSVEVPAYAQDLAEAELALIAAHRGVEKSPLFPALPYGEDYTQYIPRGHYTRSDALRAYFQALMWYGRMTFRLVKPEDEGGREETRRALLIVLAMETDPNAAALWQSFYEPTTFFVGRSDDLLYTEYGALLHQVYGDDPRPADFADDARLTQFMQAAKELRPPRILGMVIYFNQDVEETTQGFRFMGQRFIPDAYILRQLVYRNIGLLCPPDRRSLPKGLDLLAVMGSEQAYTILEEEGDTTYLTYTIQMDRLRSEFAALDQGDWTQNLYWSWLYGFFPLLEKPGSGYPVFMQSPAWLDKSLNTVLGSWTELRHDTILYAKQSYTEMGGAGRGPPPNPVPPKGYVEPVPEFYARLAALAHMTHSGLVARGLRGTNRFDGELGWALETLQDLETLALQFKTMAEKELRNEPLSEEEYEAILYYGGTLEGFTFAAADGYEGPGGTPLVEEEPQAAVVADVHTDPDPNCDGFPDDAVVLEEGVGRIAVIYAVVPIEGRLVVAKGGAFSYYEFSWPAADRLTDEAWRATLDKGEAPDLPAWTASFRVEETEEAALRAAVWSYIRSTVSSLWNTDDDQGCYEGHQQIALDYLSYDLQDATHAVVTTRETWSAERYRADPNDPEYGPSTLVARRPEHTLGRIYNLEWVDGKGWLVRQVQTEGEVPEWESVP
jgi:hypothetical protein